MPMATGAKAFLSLLVLHVGRLYLLSDRSDWPGLLQDSNLIQKSYIIKGCACSFAAHFDYTIQPVSVFKGKWPIWADENEI